VFLGKQHPARKKYKHKLADDSPPRTGKFATVRNLEGKGKLLESEKDNLKYIKGGGDFGKEKFRVGERLGNF